MKIRRVEVGVENKLSTRPYENMTFTAKISIDVDENDDIKEAYENGWSLVLEQITEKEEELRKIYDQA